MTTHYRTYHFQSLREERPGLNLQDIHVERSTFTSCNITPQSNLPWDRSIFQNVVIRDCLSEGNGVRGAVFEDITVDGLRTSSMLLLFGVACKHVTLKGRIGRVKFVDRFAPSPSDPANTAYAAANELYYQSVDWALDVRDVDPTDLDLTGVPGRLVLRDPAVSVLLTKSIPHQLVTHERIAGTTISVALDYLHRYSLVNEVVCVNWPRNNPRQALEAEAIKFLKGEGYAEPD